MNRAEEAVKRDALCEAYEALSDGYDEIDEALSEYDVFPRDSMRREYVRGRRAGYREAMRVIQNVAIDHAGGPISAGGEHR